MMQAPLTPEREIYSVSTLNRKAKTLLEAGFLSVWVEGEISNLRAPSSGHLYFTLKDAQAQVRCAMFRMRCNNLAFLPKDGIQVVARAKVSLYEDRGDFQLIVDCLEEAGDGALQRAFAALKKRLQLEGLFELFHKKLLPAFPRQVGIITSATGAAVRDIISVLKRRFAGLPIIIYPCSVQGNEAAAQIVRAIQLANEHAQCDILILARGGGSLEDLWPFNDEHVARAIYASDIPIVSGIGHEIDFTIADFVADQRAPTPSAAAELISPNFAESLQALQQLQNRIKQAIEFQLQHNHLSLMGLIKRLQSPSQKLQQQAQRLDDLEQRLRLAQSHYLRHLTAELRHATLTLNTTAPLQKIREHYIHTVNLQQRLNAGLHYQVDSAKQNLANVVRTLTTISPLNTLERGYALITANDKILKKAAEIAINAKIHIHLAEGELECLVTAKTANSTLLTKNKITA